MMKSIRFSQYSYSIAKFAIQHSLISNFQYFIIKIIFLFYIFYFTPILANQHKKNFSITHSEKGFLFSNQTESFQANLFGYAMFDLFKIKSDISELNSGNNFRYACLCLRGKMLTNFDYSFGYNFHPNSINKITDAYIAYNGWKNMYLVVGQFTPNVSVSSWTSDIDWSFLEIPLSTYLFTPDYSRGLAYDINNSKLALHISIYFPGINEDFSGKAPLSMSSRFIYSPIHTETHALSFGASTWHSQIDNTNETSYSAPPELTTRNNNVILNTNLIPNATGITTNDLEAVYVHGSWNMVAEYIHNLVHRNINNKNLQFNGCYASIGYFFTGESMIYSFPDGGFIGITDINNKKFGAWQLLARISYAGLNDKDIHGGKETNLTLGLNWHINKFLALKSSYIKIIANLPNTGAHTNSNIFALRAQLLL